MVVAMELATAMTLHRREPRLRSSVPSLFRQTLLSSDKRRELMSSEIASHATYPAGPVTTVGSSSCTSTGDGLTVSDLLFQESAVALFRQVGGENSDYGAPGRLVTVGPDVPVGLEGGLGSGIRSPGTVLTSAPEAKGRLAK
jgi:hypothetical protein